MKLHVVRLSILLGLSLAGCGSGESGASAPSASATAAAAPPALAPDPPPPSGPPQPRLDAPDTWATIRSEHFGFSVHMPPLEEAPPDLETADWVYLLSRPDGTGLERLDGPWVTLEIEAAPTSMRPRDIEDFLENRADRACASDPWGPPQYLGGGPVETRYGRPTYTSNELIHESSGQFRSGSITTRVVLGPAYVYVLQVRRRAGRPTEDVADAFFDSFELIGVDAGAATAPPSEARE